MHENEAVKWTTWHTIVLNKEIVQTSKWVLLQRVKSWDPLINQSNRSSVRYHRLRRDGRGGEHLLDEVRPVISALGGGKVRRARQQVREHATRWWLRHFLSTISTSLLPREQTLLLNNPTLPRRKKHISNRTGLFSTCCGYYLLFLYNLFCLFFVWSWYP